MPRRMKANEILCGQCHAYIRLKYKYCPICGTRKGEGKFEPFQQYQPYYGDERRIKTYFCHDCEANWRIDAINPDHTHARYCPFCRSDEIEELDEVILP